MAVSLSPQKNAPYVDDGGVVLEIRPLNLESTMRHEAVIAFGIPPTHLPIDGLEHEMLANAVCFIDDTLFAGFFT